MGFTSRNSYAGGWQPNADAVNGPTTALLRADNTVLDERGVLALRLGSAKVNGSPFADTDVHSLFTTPLGGTRYRMAGAGSAVYANGTSIASGIAGSDDIAFGFHLGQILFARSTTKKKYDGTTVRNWGIAMTGAKPTSVPIPADGKTFATCAQGESPGFTAIEGDGTGVQHTFNHYDVVDPLYNEFGAIKMSVAANSARAIYQKTWTTPQDFTVYDAGQVGSEDDVISWYLFVGDPKNVIACGLQVDCGDGRFINDWFMSPVVSGTVPPSDPIEGTPGASLPAPSTFVLPPSWFTDTGSAGPSVPRVGLPVRLDGSFGFVKIAFRRKDFVRIGLTNGKGWDTVKAIRVLLTGRQLEPSHVAVPLHLNLDTIRISGGAQRSLLGTVRWSYQYVRNASGYFAKSALSPYSTEQVFSTEAATVTIPADSSRDSQVNEVWLFRQDQKDLSDTMYRVKVQAVSGTGPYAVADLLSGKDAAILNIRAELDNVLPPNNIIGIVGPHFDRTLVVTSGGDLYPSRKLDPDAFSASQVIHVGGTDETTHWVFRALNDVFVGTSKDIYRLEGTGAELPDGSVDYILRPLSMDHRPLNSGVTHEGDQMVFFSDDGWRATGGTGSTLLTGATSLLYQGMTRHGISPVNVETGRMRAALVDGKLVAITPEGASTTSSRVLYRHSFAGGTWARHTYAQSGNWRSLHREPDGTLIAGDDAGTVWVLDTGTQDAGVNIPVVVWTKVDDLDAPYQRKKIGDAMVRIDTGGAAASLALHLNGAAAAATTLTATQTGMGVSQFDLGNDDSATKIAICKQIQIRLTGSLPAFHFYDVGWQFRERPRPIIGRVVETLGGSPGVKILSGFVIKSCTLGVQRVITAYLDGVADAETFALTTSAEEPETHELRFTETGRRATDLSLAIDGEIEIDSWSPIISQRQPVGVTVWDSGPFMDGDKELVWLRELLFKVRAGGDLVVTPYFDGTAFDAVTIKVVADVDDVYRVAVGRSYVGRQPRIVVTSCEPFHPYWVRAVRRTSGSPSGKQKVAAPFTLETPGSGG